MSDEEAREIREKAVDYADRVMAGEEPWRENPEWQEEQESLPDVRNDDVGETGERTASPPTEPDEEFDDGA